MKRLLLAIALTTFAISAAGTADARDDRRGYGYHEDGKDYWKDRRKADKRALKAQEKAEKAYWKAVKEDQKAYRRWARGQYIPVEYRQPRYYVSDYRAYHLAPPPRGYSYVRPYDHDDTYYLVELATGLITQILGD
ncbi:MAG TPA: RcnB family protein [Luteimonas sp.]|nr:RcnB family protein [Luteimonas sp.]HRO28295.1 RcnB family protein [Luteimonas sp.]HRP73274.1 RcnB family protein [Luteimonas sp.]